MPHTRQRRRAAAEALESRVLLHVEPFDPDGFGPLPSAPAEPAAVTVAGAAPNIRVTDAYLVDRNFNRLTRASIEGQSYGVRVEFTTIELPAGASYGVNFEVNGVTMVGITRTFGAGQALGTWWVGRATMFANRGPHSVRVTVDPTNTVAESDETDNAAQFSFTPAPGRPPKEFATPIEGTPAVDWAISGYPDRDPRADSFADYLGRGYTYDGHRGTDIAIADMAAMDEGVDVYAAADGTVAVIHDGEFDRQIEWLDPAPPANYVTVDHGGGWQTDYWHLRAGSVAVSPGQTVTAGQKIGEVGSSGISSGAHLHFQPRYYNEWVDPFIDPETYWLEPPAFAGDTPGVFAFTTTDHELSTNEAREHISQRHVFHRGDRVYGYVNWHGLNKELTRTNRFFRPDGSQHVVIGGNPGTADQGKAFRFAFMTLPADAPLGEWQVNIELGGVEIARTRFLVAELSEGRPEIQVFLSSNYIIDGRTTPVDFGTVARGSGPVARVFAAKPWRRAPHRQRHFAAGGVLHAASLAGGRAVVGRSADPRPFKRPDRRPLGRADYHLQRRRGPGRAGFRRERRGDRNPVERCGPAGLLQQLRARRRRRRRGGQ